MTRQLALVTAAAGCVAVLMLSATAAPEPLLEFHDPSIVRDGETYYVFSTGPGILVRRSTDLEHWTDVGPVFDEIPPWASAVAPDQKDLWAPDVSYFGKRYHLYYAISTWGTNRSAIGHATNRALSPKRSDHEWVDHGMVLESAPGQTDFNAIDAHVAFDEEARPWLFWGSFLSGIKAARLDPKTGALAEKRVVPIAQRPGGGAVEAPFVVRHGGLFYLFLSFDLCCRGAASDYRLVVGRSDRIDGPYVDRRGRALLASGGTRLVDGYGRWRGPGHNAVLLRDEGDLLVHHAYDADDGGKPRLRIRPLLWMRDGWPHAGEVEDRDRWFAEGEPPTPEGAWLHSVGDGVPARVILREGGVLGEPDSLDRWHVEDRNLILAWPRPGAPGGEWADECVLSPDGCRYVGRNVEGTIIRGWRLADLVAR